MGTKASCKYGYVNPEVESQVEALKSKRTEAYVEVDRYDVGMILADIVRSAREVRSESLLEELDALYSNIEIQARQQGIRDFD